MPVYDSILPHVAPFAASLSRLGGLFIFAPILSGEILPTRFRVYLLLALALLVYPTLRHNEFLDIRLDLVSLAPLVISEVAIGAAIGLLMLMPIALVQLAGQMMGQQMGLSLADVIDPTTGANSEFTGQLLSFIAMATFLSIGGLESLFSAVLYSFDALPMGSVTLGTSPLDAIAGLLASGYELALRVGAPVVCILFVESASMGFIMKTAPQMNIMSIGFPIRILAGFTTFTASIMFIDEAIQPDVHGAIREALQWAASLGATAN